MPSKTRAPKNRTMVLTEQDKQLYTSRLITLTTPTKFEEITNKTIHQNLLTVLPYLPHHCIDLMIIDPPYNLTKNFNQTTFSRTSNEHYQTWLDSWFPLIINLLKPNASLYICSDWLSSTAIYPIINQYLQVRNRITWEREKGRGSKTNWKNCAEDIWFCTQSKHYTFNVDAVKLKRKVNAPYTNTEGNPKDWNKTQQGNFRITHPSNLWTDISIPFWSMPENTDHPTQKPEKLIAKLILASSNPGDVIFDPFLGSGTTSVVAKKLDRQYIGVELDHDYCCLAEKRLDKISADNSIQGYVDGCFLDRNVLR